MTGLPHSQPGSSTVFADIEQIIDRGWRNGRSAAEVAAEIMRECDCAAQGTMQSQLEEAGRGAITLRNELDRVRADRNYHADLAESWKAQFHSAAAAASEYSEFWEQHHGDFDQFGNYLPYSQIDGDLRAAKRRIAETIERCAKIAEDRGWLGIPYPGYDIGKAIRALAVPSAQRPSPTYCAYCDHEHPLHEDARGFHHVIRGETVPCGHPYPSEYIDTARAELTAEEPGKLTDASGSRDVSQQVGTPAVALSHP